MPFPAIPTRVKCPRCDKSFIVQLRNVVDVGDQPELKEEFLKGEVNYARCPACGGGGVLSTPLVYHDPDKELLITYVPPELGLPADQQEQLVGDLVNSVMNSLPTEERKGYFFQPRTVLTLDSLYDAILEADGVSKEALAAQRARLTLINKLLAAIDDEEALSTLADENRDQLDYEFFLMLSNVIEARREEGSEEQHSALESLREKLLEKADFAMPSVPPEGASYDDLIEMLQEAGEGEAWRRTIALNRPRLDYGFFQALTAKIGAAQEAEDTATAEALTELRQRVLDQLDALNRVVREAEDRASLLIMKLSEAEGLEQAVREHLDEIDDVCIVVLGRLQAAARAQDDEERAEKLGAIMTAVVDVFEERLPPDLRLINGLLRAEYPDSTNEMLEEHRGLLDDAFLKTFDDYVSNLGDRDQESVEHLTKVREQIVAKITILRA